MIRVLEMYRRSLREFVARELNGLVDWPAVQIDPPEENSRWDGPRGSVPDRPTRDRDGRWREVLTARFPTLHHGLMISIESPNERPPMGRIALHGPEDIAMVGPMEAATWEAMGVRMREHFAMEVGDGC